MIKKIGLTLVVTATILLTGCSSKEPMQETRIELDTLDKKLSYLFAFDTASQFKNLDIILDADVVRQGAADASNGVESDLSIEEIKATINSFRLMQIESNEN